MQLRLDGRPYCTAAEEKILAKKRALERHRVARKSMLTYREGGGGALSVPCPVCFAREGGCCFRPIGKNMRWVLLQPYEVHLKRVDRAEKAK
jgi:hypothetical protein